MQRIQSDSFAQLGFRHSPTIWTHNSHSTHPFAISILASHSRGLTQFLPQVPPSSSIQTATVTYVRVFIFTQDTLCSCILIPLLYRLKFRPSSGEQSTTGPEITCYPSRLCRWRFIVSQESSDFWSFRLCCGAWGLVHHLETALEAELKLCAYLVVAVRGAQQLCPIVCLRILILAIFFVQGIFWRNGVLNFYNWRCDAVFSGFSHRWQDSEIRVWRCSSVVSSRALHSIGSLVQVECGWEFEAGEVLPRSRLFVERCFVLLFMSLPKLSAMSLSFSFQWYLVTKYEFVFYQVTCASLHEVECKIWNADVEPQFVPLLRKLLSTVINFADVLSCG
jgi:hypothetical protein